MKKNPNQMELMADSEQVEADLKTRVDKANEPVTCLGITFLNDEDRRKHFTELLREKLKDSEFRKIEGFPIGKDEDILALSDPPYYTACPNPWIGDFVKEWEAAKPVKPHGYVYEREPYASDVSEGKNDPIYNAHSYHTKVPHKAIMRYIQHYTEPGDIVFDGFCGTGMTGVAAALCGESGSDRAPDYINTKVGQRNSIINDLSPAATFIASNLLSSFSKSDFLLIVNDICARIEAELGHFYETNHNGWKVHQRKTAVHKHYVHKSPKKGIVEFTLYADAVRCPECTYETNLYAVAIDEQNDCFRPDIECPKCKAKVPESKWEPVMVTIFDHVLNEAVQTLRIVPIQINYSIDGTRFEKLPDDDDLEIFRKTEKMLATKGLTPIRLIEGKETQRNVPIGITHLHQFFTPREHLFLAALLSEIQSIDDSKLKSTLLFSLTAALPYMSRMRRFRPDRKGGGPLSGTLYVGSLITPPHVLKTFKRNAITISNSLNPPIIKNRNGHLIGTQSTGNLATIPDNSIDYIFTDPPFGFNFDYSELNFFWEGLLKVITNQDSEAIISSTQKKGISQYRNLMTNCFKDAYRILKPGRWMTVEFSNTKALIWNSIQTALTDAGFIVANVSALDKKQGSFKAVTTPTAVKQDLVISAYKPNGGFEERFLKEAQTEEGIWDFVRTHLKYLPVIKKQGTLLQKVAERDPRILFDQMIAYYVRKGYNIPIDSQEFQSGLTQRFSERDGMYFLPEQAAEYDKKKATSGFDYGVQQDMFVDDEASAIEWLQNLLKTKPQTFQDINPEFMQKISCWKKTEKGLELSTLLHENFICYDGIEQIPEQIHAYLSTNWKDMRNLPKNDSTLIAKAKDRWYVPDPNKAGDIEKLREKSLLREFDVYKEATKKLKVFRLEAVRAGFKKAWQDRDYSTIISVAEKVPNDILEEDPKLLMWYDQAVTRKGDV